MMLELVLLGLVSGALCQDAISALQPDVSFGDQNDRFDLTSFLRHQNRYFKEHNRRNLPSNFADIPNDRPPGPGAETRLENFAYHDDMNSLEGDGGAEEFENNLKAYQAKNRRRYLQKIVDNLHGGRRRSGVSPSLGPDPEHELLLHYGVPIQMKISGYLQMPKE